MSWSSRFRPLWTGSAAISLGYIKDKKIPLEFRPATAVTKLSTISGKQAVASFGVGQVLVASMFASTSSGSNFTQFIPSGDVAVTASVDQVHGVAGFPVPGDKVDLMITLNSSETLLLQNVSILADRPGYGDQRGHGRFHDGHHDTGQHERSLHVQRDTDQRREDCPGRVTGSWDLHHSHPPTTRQ